MGKIQKTIVDDVVKEIVSICKRNGWRNSSWLVKVVNGRLCFWPEFRAVRVLPKGTTRLTVKLGKTQEAIK